MEASYKKVFHLRVQRIKFPFQDHLIKPHTFVINVRVTKSRQIFSLQTGLVFLYIDTWIVDIRV